MTLTRILFIRHGETVFNIEGKIQGNLDSPLTEIGQRQARAVAHRLRHTPPAHIYTSDLGRALATAQLIAQTTHCPLATDERLRERNMGIFQGLTFDEIARRYPDESGRLKTATVDYIPTGGESADQTRQRAWTALNEFADGHPGQEIAVISHGAVIAAVIRHILGMPYEVRRSFKIFNAGINVLTRKNNHWAVETLGDICHLNHLHTGDEITR